MKRFLRIGPILISLILPYFNQVYAYPFEIDGFIHEIPTGLPMVNHPVEIFSQDGEHKEIVMTDDAGQFSAHFKIDSGETIIFIVQTTDICSGDIKSMKVPSQEGVTPVHFEFCALDTFPCQAFFTIIQTADLTFHFLDESSSPSPLSWHWNFGDGQVSQESSPVHSFDSAGTYTITLYLEAADSCKSTLTKRLEVGDFSCHCAEYYRPVCVEDIQGTRDTFDNICFAQCVGYEYLVACNVSCECPDTVDPVCVLSIEGELVYKNACEAACAGFKGPYFCDTSCVCPEIYAPVCVVTDAGTVYNFANECFARCAGYFDFIPCDPDCYCDDIYQPACVYLTDGQVITFDNPCLAECAGYTDYLFCDSSCICDATYDPVCIETPDGKILTFGNLCLASCQGYPDALPCDSCGCDDAYAPVCVFNIDSTTLRFNNACLAACAGYADFGPCTSPCGCEGIIDPVCVIEDNGNVKNYQSACAAICEGYDVFYNCQTICICTAQYDPVCATLPDGSEKIFSNACYAACAGIYNYRPCETSLPVDDHGSPEIQPNLRQNKIMAAPNPFDHSIFLRTSLEGHTSYNLAVINLVGQKIWSAKIKPDADNWSQQITLNNFVPGVYFLQIRGNNVFEQTTIIKE